MKVAIIALVLTISLAYTQCQVPTGSWGGYGGVGVYGGIYGLGYSGLLGSYHNLGFYGKRSSAEESPESNEKESMLKVSQRTECVYTKDSGMLSCHGPTLIVECETELNWDKQVEFNLYGIAKCDKSEKMFRIIPRKMDNSGWSAEDKVYVYLSGEKTSGLAIKEMECFAKLTELFQDSLRNEKVYLDSAVETVKYIIGDLMVAEEMPKMVIKSLETKEMQPRNMEDIMDRLDAIDDVLADEYDEQMQYKRATMEKFEELEKRML